MAEAVCERRLSEGRCKVTRKGCSEVNVQDLSDDERTRRSDRMKEMWRKKREATNG
jgi:hypothetical protein